MSQAAGVSPRRGGGSVVLPALLIGLVVVVLLANLGILPALSWRSLWQFWPVLLIVLGVELLLTGHVSWAVFWIGVLLAVTVAVLLTVSGYRIPSPLSRGALSPEAQRFEQALGGATQADVKIEHGAGRLSISDDAGAGLLLAGHLAGDEGARVDVSYRVSDGTGQLTLAPTGRDGPNWLFGSHDAGHDLTVRLSNAVPIRRLEVNTGAADATLELTNLQVQQLDLNTGASSAAVRLPARGQVAATISAGATGLAITIPPEVAARIRVDGGLSGITIDRQRFPVVRQEGIPGLGSSAEYQSPGYAGAANRVDLRISVGASGVEIR